MYPDHTRSAARGLTMVELMIAVTIIAILAAIAVPQYGSAIRTARIGKCRHELVTLAHAIAAYQAANGGALPLTLYQVGFGGRRDPWGTPYCYFNYADGTGDGLDWAVAAGLVNPAVIIADAGPSPAREGPRLAGFWPGFAGAGPQGPVATDQARERANERSAVVQAAVAKIEGKLKRTLSSTERTALVASLGAPTTISVFVEVEPETTRRRDGFLFPLNTDYDLFSLGADGRTAVSLGQTVARDDVIRANNGGFFGVASEY